VALAVRATGTLSNSRADHDSVRPCVSARIFVTASTSTGIPSLSHDRRTYVSAPAICASLSAARLGMSRLKLFPSTLIGPRRPLSTMRTARSGGPRAQSDPTSGGANPAKPIPSGL